MTQEYYGKQLLENIKMGDIGGVKSSLGNNADVNYLDKDIFGSH